MILNMLAMNESCLALINDASKNFAKSNSHDFIDDLVYGCVARNWHIIIHHIDVG